MPTATLHSPYPSLARNFALTAIAYGVGLFGVLKFGWVETHLVLPPTQYQGMLAEAVFGTPALPIDVTLACSGTDAFALCAGAILAYPAAWRLRLGGTAAGLMLILILNVVRIGSLGRVAASPLWFEILHVYVWPALLILAIAGYVFAWMQFANAQSRARMPGLDHTSAEHATAEDTSAANRTTAFVVWTVLLVLLFVATSSFYLQSPTVLAAAALIAQAAAAVLGMIGVTATTIDSTLWTSKGGFEVTQECITTPLIPLYGAAVMSYCARWRWRLPLMAAAVPLFFALGVARLLVVALPAALIGSPLFLVHAFYQVLLAAVVVAAVATWRRGALAWGPIATACVIGALAAYLLAPIYAGLPSAIGLEIPFNDSQGAMASLPSFQTGFYLALSIAGMTVLTRRSFAAGLLTLAAVQVVAFGIAVAVAQYGGPAPHVRNVRAWAIVVPLMIVLFILVPRDRPHD